MTSSFSKRRSLLLILPLLLGARAVAAGDQVRVESKLYVFNQARFHSVTIGSTRATDQATAVVSPGTIVFDGSTLTLAGHDFNWSGGVVPRAMSLAELPAIITSYNRSAACRVLMPTQYFEKIADGRYALKETPDSEAPHWQLSFLVQLLPDSPARIDVDCTAEWAAIARREKMSGVDLEVGKPVIATGKYQASFATTPGDWSAVLFHAPAGSEYGALLLVRVIPLNAAPMASHPPAAGLMTPAELDAFATNYYRHPQPDLIPQVIESIAQDDYLKTRGQMFIGFFSELFGANPNQVEGWRKLFLKNWDTRPVLFRAYDLREPGALINRQRGFSQNNHTYYPDGSSIKVNDMLWGAFFASGNPAYIRVLANEMKWIDRKDRGTFWTGGTAMLSLARNAIAHPLVRTTLETTRSSADQRTRELIDDVLKNNPEAIQQDIVAKWKSLPAEPSDINISRYYQDTTHDSWTQNVPPQRH